MKIDNKWNSTGQRFMDLIKQSISGSFLYVTKYYLLCRGFTVETCIVVQHVGGGSTNSPQTSPVAKKPCPPIQVILDSITFCFQILLQKKCKKKISTKLKLNACIKEHCQVYLNLSNLYLLEGTLI